MKDREILTNAIDKAIDKGYRILDPIDAYKYYQVIIFSHSFAKAFWGEEYISNPIHDSDGDVINDIGDMAWKMHLQQIVLKEGPIKYLEKFL